MYRKFINALTHLLMIWSKSLNECEDPPQNEILYVIIQKLLIPYKGLIFGELSPKQNLAFIWTGTNDVYGLEFRYMDGWYISSSMCSLRRKSLRWYKFIKFTVSEVHRVYPKTGISLAPNEKEILEIYDDSRNVYLRILEIFRNFRNFLEFQNNLEFRKV